MPSSPAPGSRSFIGAVHDEWRMFSDNPDDYEIGLPIGFGATSIVYAARYVAKDCSPPYPCAVKVIDLDKLPPQSLRLLRRETQLMSLSKHPNVLRVRGSWMTGHNLYIALRLMNAGSAADIMQYGWPGGMEEDVVKCVLKQALEGLNYLHINGFIHRDVKAANLLIDDDGTVLLGDLGVAASLNEEPIPIPTSLNQTIEFAKASGGDSRTPTQGPSKSRLGKRKSFVGTPCWMAPELISGNQYDAKADIWSFGITAIELTQGRAPRSRETPARVLLRTVQDAPPEFARESGQYKFSKAFKEIVEACLLKDPARRPTAAELLETSFFKSAKRKSYLVNAILKDLPPLIYRQERRAKPSSVISGRTRNSTSSWDFSIELPNLANPSYLNTIHSHHSRHTTLTLPSPTRLHALEENQHSDAFEQAEAAGSELPSTDVDEETHDADHSRSSMETRSSVFDVEQDEDESNPTTPELAATSVDGSSVTTTPLSCSPATALDIPVRPSSPHLVTPLVSKTAANRCNDADEEEGSKAQHIPARRRDSSPASTTIDRVNVGSLPALKRIASASTGQSAGGSSRPPPQSSTPKGSRWRRLIHGPSTTLKADDPAESPESLKDGERRKSIFGRILERSGK